MSTPPFISEFWGKAQPDAGSGPQWHPLAYHMLDVAAVAHALLRVRPVTRARASRFLGMSESDASRLLVLVAALHDLGKFGRAFQNKAPENWGEKNCRDKFDPRRRHDADGLLIWHEVVRDRVVPPVWPNAEDTFDVFMKASTAHHGRPVSSSQEANVMLEFGPGADAACLCAEELVRLLFGPPLETRPPRESEVLKVSHWLAGFVTLADWVGSNTEWFPYCDPNIGLPPYWANACANAERAVRAAGLNSSPSAPLKSFAELTGVAPQPSPVQEWAASVALPDGPCLIFIEDVTGSGKTEAAQMLVHRLMTQGRASGAYWAMPTQATANAMWERQRSAVTRLYAADAKPSLALAHGQAALSDPFQKTVLRRKQGSDVYDSDNDDADRTATASCTAFLAHDKRAALVADIGAGTIDQALLAALPAKFNTMRLFGLAEKVLLLDEAHAYDAYVQAETEGLLRFQAALGGSAIVLSATLPMKVRRQYVRAWQSACGTRNSHEPVDASYPLATIVQPSEIRECPLEAAARSRRTAPVRLIHDERAAISSLATAASAGGAVAWIRNTVDDALSAAGQLRAQGVEVVIFHARFAQCDRQQRERLVMDTFGEESVAEQRRGKVLIATQVIEQSLDLDFDLMISDLAPIDLLIQRAGRLRRHPERNPERPPEIPFEFIVLTPPLVECPDEKWIKAAMPGTAAVYRNPTILWRTARALARERAIVAPDAFRPLVEEIYEDVDLPEVFSKATLRAEGEASAFRSQGQQAVLKPEKGYSPQTQWEDERRIETRINNDSMTIRLGRIAADGALVPWATNEGPDWKAWALSEVRVRAWLLPEGARAPAKFAAAVDAVRSSWKRFEQEIPLLVMGSPSLLTDRIDSNPVVALAAPRPDFNGALLEFLIGLFTAALQPEDEEAWRELWRTPPSPAEIQAALDRLPDAFSLDGDGARFLQDAAPDDFADCEATTIELLLIDAAGGQTVRLNKDLFVKRDRIAKLGRPAAAMALLALQTYAPSGGQGHRTSMRGGGPLTTLVEPRTREEDGGSLAHEQPLWRKIWANVETVEQWRARAPDTAAASAALLYPWLAPTRTSNSKAQGQPTTPQDAHPLQAYFGMPRRIRLDFTGEAGDCSLTGKKDTAFASSFRARNYGIEYDSWIHPLSPYYRDKNGGWLPEHGQSDGIGWRNWAALLFGSPDDGRRPAQCVADFAENRASTIRIGRPRLHAFGYDMDNMKARGWVEAELPAFALADHEQAKTIARIAASLTEAASLAASALLVAVKSARFQRSEDAKGDLSYVKARFWSETQGDFFAAIKRALAIGAPQDIETTIKQEFREPLELAALSIFDSLCPMDALEFADVRRLVAARHGLRSDLRGYRKLGAKLFTALALPQPEGAKAARKRKEAAG